MVVSILPMTVLADNDADVEADPTTATAVAGFTPVDGTEVLYYADTSLETANTASNTYTSAENAFAAAINAWAAVGKGTVTLYTDITLSTLSAFTTGLAIITVSTGDSLTLNLEENTITFAESFADSDGKPPYFISVSGAECDLTINGGKIRTGTVDVPVTRPFLQIGSDSNHSFVGSVTLNGVDICQIGNTSVIYNKGDGGTITLNGGKYISSDQYIIGNNSSTYNTSSTTIYLTGGVELVTKQFYAVRVGTNGSKVFVDDAVVYTHYTNYTNGYYVVGNTSRPGLTIMAGTSSSGGGDYKYDGLVIVSGSSLSADGTEISLDTFTPHVVNPDTAYPVYTLTVAPAAVTPPATATKAAGVTVIPGKEIPFYVDTAEDLTNNVYTSAESAFAAALTAWDAAGNGTVTLYQDVAISGSVTFPGAGKTALVSVGANEALTLTFADGVEVTDANNTSKSRLLYVEGNAQVTLNGGSFAWSKANLLEISNITNLNFTGVICVNNVNAVVTAGFDFISNNGKGGNIIFNDGFIKVYKAGGSGSGLVIDLHKNAYESTTAVHLRGGVEFWCYQFVTMRVGENAKVYAEDVIAHANAKSSLAESSIQDDQEGCWGVAGYFTSAGSTKYTGNNVVLGSMDGTVTSEVTIGARVQFPELEPNNTSSVTYLATTATIKPQVYTVTWCNADGTVLETDENVTPNAMPEYNGETPVKASDSEYNYYFAGWDKEITAVTGDVTYTATYVSVPLSYTAASLDLVKETDLYKSYGRMYTSDNGLAINWPGSGVEFQVECGGDVTITYTAEEAGYFQCYVDGQPALRAHTAVGQNCTTKIAEGVPSGVHTIRIIRDHDTSSSGLKFELASVNFVGKKETLKASADKELLIEFVGDSITSGKGALLEYLEDNQIYGEGCHSGTSSYAYLTAQNMDADWTMLSRGSMGYFRTSTSCPKTIESLYPYYNGLMADPIPYTASRQADVAVLALCTNDSTSAIEEAIANGTTSYTDMEGAVNWLIAQVRSQHGDDVKIVLLYGMMTSNSTWVPTFTSIADADPNVYLLKTTQNNDGGRGSATATGHPSAAGHVVIAEELTEFLQGTVLADTEFDMDASMDNSNGYSLQFFVDKAKVTNGCSAAITRTYADGRTPTSEVIPAENWTDYSDSLYCVNYTGIAAKDISDKVTVGICNADQKVLSLWTGTVSGLAAEKAQSSDETEKNRTLALLGFSAAAQNYFGYNAGAENTFAAEIDALKEAHAEELAVCQDSSSLSGTETDLVYGSSMVLGAELTMKVYFTSGDISVLVDGASVTLQQADGTSYYFCEIPVNAESIFDAISIQVLRDGNLVASASDSPASYFARLYETGSDTAKELAVSVLLYGLIATTTE